jgi:uncharacterized membrane protein YczE
VSRPAQPHDRVPNARRPLAWVRLLAGLWLFAVGAVLGLRSGLGVAPWDVFHDGIRQVTPLSFGAATVLVGLVLVVVALACGVRPGPGTLVNMVAIGLFADTLLDSGLVGVGTVLFALGIGPAVQLAFRVLRVDVRGEPNPRRGMESACLECCSG